MRIFCAAMLVSLSAFVGVQQASAASQQIIGSNFESFTDLASCQALTCTVSFLAIPAGKTILVNRVLCRSVASNNARYMYFGPSTVSGGSLTKETYFEKISSEYISSYYYSTHESSPLIMIGPGRFPTVFFQIGAVSPINLQCSLGGTVVQG